MKKNSYIAPLFILLLFHASCGHKTVQENTETHAEDAANTIELTNEQFTAARIQTGKIEIRQISGTIKTNGKLDVPPQQKVSISLPFGGFLKNTELLQGMKVKKGQLIAVIENPDFIQVQQDYLDVASRLEFAKAEYERQQTLAAENVNAQKTLQQAKSTYQSLLAQHSGLSAKLKLMNIHPQSVSDGNITSTVNIYSPISGYVTTVNANIGMYLNLTDVLFEIVDTQHLHAELTLFEKDISALEIGQKVKFVLANEREEREATVYLIGREIKEDRTVNIHCHLNDEDVNLIPGTYLKAYIETGGNEVNAVPDEALVQYQGKKYIFLEEEGHEEGAHHFTLLEVETGNRDNGYTELIGVEISENQTLVLKGAYDLLSALKNRKEEGEHGH